MLVQIIREVNHFGNGAVAAQLSKLFTVVGKFEQATQAAVKKELGVLLAEKDGEKCSMLKSEPREVLERIHGSLFGSAAA